MTEYTSPDGDNLILILKKEYPLSYIDGENVSLELEGPTPFPIGDDLFFKLYTYTTPSGDALDFEVKGARDEIPVPYSLPTASNGKAFSNLQLDKVTGMKSSIPPTVIPFSEFIEDDTIDFSTGNIQTKVVINENTVFGFINVPGDVSSLLEIKIVNPHGFSFTFEHKTYIKWITETGTLNCVYDVVTFKKYAGDEIIYGSRESLFTELINRIEALEAI